MSFVNPMAVGLRAACTPAVRVRRRRLAAEFDALKSPGILFIAASCEWHPADVIFDSFHHVLLHFAFEERRKETSTNEK